MPSLMVLEVAETQKMLATVLALVRSFPCMRAHVNYEVAALGEGSAANFALALIHIAKMFLLLVDAHSISSGEIFFTARVGATTQIRGPK